MILLYEMDYKSYAKKNVYVRVEEKDISLFDLKLDKESPDIKTILIRAYFTIITFGKFKIYYVKDDEDKIIHTSYVIEKNYKFPFMKKGDIQIGPCFTSPESRGKGIYKNVLEYINSNSYNKYKRAYMIVNETNVSSVKGIENSGFKKVGTVAKNGVLKIYRREQNV